MFYNNNYMDIYKDMAFIRVGHKELGENKKHVPNGDMISAHPAWEEECSSCLFRLLCSSHLYIGTQLRSGSEQQPESWRSRCMRREINYGNEEENNT
jgi:hypothetical protein